ncbi:hypothetical protein HYALB_00000183 [Hymenoscyphus albidus]|uniref:GPI anchored serine-threonine rich protein n=1 Tax=Hymenoscyphus albidus TaxID=595503 RepID=A0A9N9LPN0_9HELO|nr:hypothetical protein HYALB_00000183 [Hymenoscyphus albidus]
MHFFVPVVSSLLVSLVAGQTTCAAKPVFDSCMATTMGYVSSCSNQDMGCLCRTWGDVLNCYLQCPEDIGYQTALASKTAYCNSASAYPSTTPAVSGSPTAAPPSGANNAVSSGSPSTTLSGPAATSRPTGTASSSAAPASTSGSSAERVVVGAGGLLMGLVAAVL